MSFFIFSGGAINIIIQVIKENKLNDNGDEILLKYENKFNALKYKDHKLLISSGENLGDFKKWDTLAKLDNLNFLLKKAGFHNPADFWYNYYYD